MIYVKPKAGLCNRLRTIASVIEIARNSKGRHSVCVVWSDEDGMTAKYSELFLPSSEFTLVEYGTAGYSDLCEKFVETTPGYVGQEELMSDDDRTAVVERIVSSFDSFYIESYSEVMPIADYSWLKPMDGIAREVGRILLTLGDNSVGIHIRRTDNLRSIIYSPTELFEEMIRSELAQDPSKRFFLATDDERVKKDLSAMFGDNIVTRTDIASRYEHGGICDAVIDLLVLAKTRKIYGSHWSSFSVQAAKIGGVPCVRLYDSDHSRAVERAIGMIAACRKEIAILKTMLRSSHRKGVQPRTVNSARPL